MYHAQQWRMIQIDLKARQCPENPSAGADIWGEFVHESGTIVKIPAFWNGEKDYGIRFAPTKTGIWNYRISALPEILGLDGMTGQVNCQPYEGQEDIYRHGFLKKGPRGRYLSYQDNTPFFWLGDTHWGFITQEQWDESNDPSMASQFKGMVNCRKTQGFTVYQCNMQCLFKPDNDRPFYRPVTYFIETDQGWLPNLDVFKNNMDLKMAYLSDLGFVIALGFSWYSSIDNPGAADFYKMVARYIIARYGAYPIVWTLAGEVAGYNQDKRNIYINGWRQVALEIQRLDGYGHLQTCHYTNERPLADYYQEEDWYDFTLNQCGHGDLPINQKVYRAHMDKYPVTPFVEGEALYDGLTTIEDLQRRTVDAKMVRLAAYTAMQNGACGYTYGAQGCWNGQWDWPQKEENTYWGSMPWFKGIYLDGADSMKIMRDFYEQIEWFNLSPMYHACQIHNPENTEQFLLRATPEVMTSPDTRIVTAYFKGIAVFPLRLNGLAFDAYRMQWFDPSTGKWQEEESFVKTVSGGVEIPVKPDEKDWMLVLTAWEEEV